MGYRKCGKAEIGFRLAAACREEQQIDDFAIGMRLVDEPGQIKQNKGELEGTPSRRLLDAQIDRCACGASAGSVGDRIATPRGARDRLVHDAEGEPRASVAFDDTDPRSDPSLRRAHPRDDALARLAPAARQRADRVLLSADPGRIQLRQLGKARYESFAALPSECRDRLHPELDIRDVFIRRDPLDFGQWQVVGPNAADLPVLILGPRRGSVSADGIFLDVPIMQVRNLQVLVCGTVARQVITWAETAGADELEARLKSVGRIGIPAPRRRHAPIDEKYGDGTHALLGGVGQAICELARVGGEFEGPATGHLRWTAVRHQFGTATAGDRERHRALLWNPNPTDMATRRAVFIVAA